MAIFGRNQLCSKHQDMNLGRGFGWLVGQRTRTRAPDINLDIYLPRFLSTLGVIEIQSEEKVEDKVEEIVEEKVEENVEENVEEILAESVDEVCDLIEDGEEAEDSESEFWGNEEW